MGVVLNLSDFFINAGILEGIPARHMQVSTDHLQLVFMASTVSAAWDAGWVATTVPAPRLGQISSPPMPAPVRLMVVPA